MPEGRGGGCPVPALKAFQRIAGERGRKLEVDRARDEPAPDREATLQEDLHHLVVGVHHLGLELGDARRRRGLGEVPEEDRAHPFALELVGDGQRHLGAIDQARGIERMRDQPGVAAGGGDQAVAAPVVNVEKPGHDLLEVGTATEEAERPRLG